MCWCYLYLNYLAVRGDKLYLNKYFVCIFCITNDSICLTPFLIYLGNMYKDYCTNENVFFMGNKQLRILKLDKKVNNTKCRNHIKYLWQQNSKQLLHKTSLIHTSKTMQREIINQWLFCWLWNKIQLIFDVVTYLGQIRRALFRVPSKSFHENQNVLCANFQSLKSS